MTCHILLLHPSQHKQRNTLITQKSNHCVIVQLHNQHSPAAHAAWTPLMYSCKQQPSVTIVGHPTHGNLACYTTSQLPLLLCYQYTAIKPLRHCTAAQPAAHAAWTPLMYSCKQQPSITIVGHLTLKNCPHGMLYNSLFIFPHKLIIFETQCISDFLCRQSSIILSLNSW